MRELLLRLDPFIKLLFLGGLILVGVITFKTRTEISEIKNISVSGTKQEELRVIERCGVECEDKIKEVVSQAIATLSGKTVQKITAPAATTQTTTQITSQTSYVPVGGAGSTTKTDWADLFNTDFFLDLGEYGKLKETRWSANLKIFQNGESFARLFDFTHGVAVPGSEISTKNVTYTLIESGPLTFLAGKNVYRVQMKSLTGYEASFDAGRIKIVTE